ncbi:MAG TPA: tRNA (adenosine(37)-N6)-threonylcarbamoyltransferase complex ATPase subunit type 1 TsaE [Gemmataceae bacterium]|jgi:tRNA threonylcarbamoyladenosine biosynthesis protein TsaE|nr:tRNA (adenosine(37)-N6)-threonylcarbamoyltransferase complex ATPase subunit type 1 TsaE [Gemmataceae bacterium]
MVNELEIVVSDLAGTEAFGRRLAAHLFGGAVIALIGPLGAGKTHLVRAVAEGLGVVDSRVVSSPTFVLIQEYTGRLPIYHFDAYRLKHPGEFVELGVHEYFEGKGVCLVEWADRVEDVLPQDHLRVTLQIIGETGRRIKLEARGLQYESLLQAMAPSAIETESKQI